MSNDSARIHPTAIIDPRAQIGEGVEVGPFTVIEGPVTLGPSCVIRSHARLVGPAVFGRGNDIGTSAVLGERPQHLQYKGEPTRLEVGDENVFREHVTIHRGSPATGVTIIGSRNYFMVNTHVAHDCRVGNDVVLANGALLAGHCELGDRVFVSGNSAMHQYVRLGRLCFLSGLSSSVKDILPFLTVMGRDKVVGVNIVGMRRAGMASPEIRAVQRAYHILYRSGLMQRLAVQQLESELGTVPAVAEMLAFIRSSRRGFVAAHKLESDDTQSEAA